MIDTALYFLHKVAVSKPDNQFAKAIYNKFKEAGDNVDKESLNGLLNIPFDDKTVLAKGTPVTIERKKDYRFHWLFLKSFRKFPNLPENEYYGISFYGLRGKTQRSETTLLQGSNGAGKTSVFGAMEYLFTGRISAAEKMNILTKEELERYMCFAGGKKEDIDIRVETQPLVFKLNSKETQQKDFCRLNLRPFFCSEYDVDKSIDEKVNDFVYEQIGFTLIRDIIQKIGQDIKSAISQYEPIEKRSDNMEALVDVLDKEVLIYKDLKNTITSIAVKMRNVSNPKNELESLKKTLVDNYVLKTDEELAQGTKSFTLENVEEEKEKIKKVMGKKAYFHSLNRLYTEVINSFQTEQEQLDNLPISAINPQREQQVKLAENFNFARKCILQIVEDLLKLKPEQFFDTASWVEQYDAFLKDNEEKLQQARDSLDVINKVKRIDANKEIFVEFYDALKSEVYGTLNLLTIGTRDLVNEVMKLFLMKGEGMELKFNKDDGRFSMDISFQLDDGRTARFTPEQYLNTFRYKLYCMTLKIAIAFAMKKFYQMNFPIVLDDIFYSSDFTHRSMVRDYFWHIFKIHKELFQEEYQNLQIIFFTHDDLLIEAAHRGICDATCGLLVNRQVMFDYHELDKPKKVRMKDKSEDGQPNTVKIKIRNLAYTIA